MLGYNYHEKPSKDAYKEDYRPRFYVLVEQGAFQLSFPVPMIIQDRDRFETPKSIYAGIEEKEGKTKKIKK